MKINKGDYIYLKPTQETFTQIEQTDSCTIPLEVADLYRVWVVEDIKLTSNSVNISTLEDMGLHCSWINVNNIKEIIPKDFPRNSKQAQYIPEWLHSKLENVVTEITSAPNIKLDEAKQMIYDIIEPSDVNEPAKRKILYNIDKQYSLQGLIKYLYNSILKYLGLGVITTERRQIMKKLNMRKKAENFKQYDMNTEKNIPDQKKS